MPIKKQKVPVKVVARAKAIVAPKPALQALPSEKKAKVVAALKRLHPMD